MVPHHRGDFGPQPDLYRSARLWVRIMKPRLYWNPKAKYWVCASPIDAPYCFAMGSSPKVAYAVWNLRSSEAQMHALIETL